MANNPKQRCSTLWNVLEVFSPVVNEAVIAPDPAATSRRDYTSSRPERTLLHSLRKIKAQEKLSIFVFYIQLFYKQNRKKSCF